MRKRKTGILGRVTTRGASHGFVNRRSTVQSRPPAQDSSNSQNRSNHRSFVAAAIALGASDLEARRLLVDLLDLGRDSRKDGRSNARILAQARLIADVAAKVIESRRGARAALAAAVAANLLTVKAAVRQLARGAA